MKAIKVNNAKDFFKAIHKMQRGYKFESYATPDGYVYNDGICVGRVILDR